MASPVDRRLIRESRIARRHFALAAALGAASAVVIVAQASLLAYIIARSVTHHTTLSALQRPLIALGATLLARALLSGGFELSGRYGATRVMSELRGRLIRLLLLEGPEQRPSGARTGELANVAVQGVDALETYFAAYLPQLVLATLVPIATITWVLTLDPITAVILAATVPILVVFMVLIGKGAREQSERRWRALTLLGAHFLDVVQGLATLRAYRRENVQEQALADVGERYRMETMRTLRTAFLSAFVLELCATIGTALVAATIGVQLIAGALSLQSGLTVLLLAPELYGPLRQVGQQFHASTDAGTASERIFDALNGPAPLRRTARPVPSRDPASVPVRFEAVGYEYPRGHGEALTDVTLELEPGRMTVLLGRSGAGKSTIARLLLRLADPTGGVLTCGGVDLRDFDPDDWRSQIAWVPQQPTLFSGTVAENLALYRPYATAAEIEGASRAAGAHEFVTQLADAYQTRVGEGARRLSAGQAQRVALARAFLADRPLLVMDEPSAHLDDDATGTICQAIRGLARGRTTLLIAHQPLLAELADATYTIHEGRLAPAAESPAVTGFAGTGRTPVAA